MAGGGNDIDSLKFTLVLDSKKFEADMKRVEGLAEKFEKSVKDAFAVTNLLNEAQNKGTKATKEKAAAEKEVVLLTRQELEAKKAAGTITDKELKQLKQIIAADKALLDEENKKLTAQKKQLDIQGKQERLARRRKQAEEETGEAIQLNSAALLKQSALVKGLGSMMMQYASVFGAAAVVRNLVRITGEFEAQRAALRAILMDTAAADNIFNQLQTLAVKSPFTFQNLVSYAKQLTAFSVPVNEVYETTKKLADVSAGLGVDMGRIILAYGQVRSAEFLRGQEVRQFTEAGIPILKELADQFKEIEGHAISVGEVFERISARQVPFEMVEEAFNRMTSAGGKFYQMQEVLAETVKGKISNLQDAWEIMLSRIGNEHSGTIKGIITGITNLLANYEKWIGLLSAIIKYIGLYSAGMVVLNSVTRTANALSALRNGLELVRNQQIKLTTMLLPTQNALEKISIANEKEEAAVLATLNLARKAAIGILALLGAAIWAYVQHLKRMNDEENKAVDTINTAVAKLNATMADFEIGANRVENAFKKMKEKEGDATEETKAFHKAVDDLKKQFPKFIDDNMKLAETVDDLGKYWARAREEMNQYFADEARESVHTDLQQNRDEEISGLSKKFTKSVKSWFSRKDKNTLGKNYATMAWRYVVGDISRDEVTSIVNAMNEYYRNWSGSSLDYSQRILDQFDEYVSEYRRVMGRYEEALDDTDRMLNAHQLSSTRQNFNEYIFSVAGTGAKANWSLDGGAMSPFSMFSKEDQDRIFQWWIENDDFAFRVDDTVEKWADRQRELLQDGNTSENVKSVIRSVFEQFNIEETPGAVTGWKKDVNDMIDDFGTYLRKTLTDIGDMTEDEIEDFVSKNQGIGNKLKVKETSQLGDVVAKWIKDLDETQKAMDLIPEKYQNLQNDAYSSLWLNQLLLQMISSGLYGEGVVDFAGHTKDSKKDERERERERKERERKYQEYKRNQISDLKQKFQDLKELKAAYDGFKKSGFNDNQIGGLLMNFFGTGIPKGGFDTAFESLAKQMDKYSPNDAQDIRNFAAGKDWKEYSKKIEEAEKATRKFEESLEDLRASTKRLNFEGFAAELDKIIVDADSKNRKLRTDWAQKLDDLAEAKEGWIARYKVEFPDEDAEKAWEEYYKNQKKIIEDLIDTQIEYNNKVAQGQIDKKADDWVKTMMEEWDIDMTDWADKTPAQIDDIKKRLEDLKYMLPTLIPDELKEDAKTVEATFDNLLALIEKILNAKIDTTDIEKAKKDLQQMTKDLKSVGTYLSKIGSAVSQFGGDWEGVGGALNDAGNNLSSLADVNQKFQSGQMSKAGAQFSYIMIAVENIVSTTARAIENFRDMKEATKAWELELKRADYELENLQLAQFGYKQKNIFGVENPYSKAIAASEQLRQAQEKLLGLSQEISDIQVKTGQKKAQDWGDSAKTVLEMTAAGAAIGAAAGGGVLSWASVWIGAAAGFITGVITAAATSKKMVDVFESLGEITGGQIFDPKTLELTDEVLAKYNQMDDAGKALVDHWKEIREVMKDALDTFNENVEAVVGDIGESIKEMLVTAFNNDDVYGAIDDLHDYIGDTIQSLMIDIAFSRALQPLFDQLEADMRHSFGIDPEGNPLAVFDEAVDYDWVDDLMKFNVGLQEALPLWNQAMLGAQQAMETLGYDWNYGDSDSSGSLGSGIKSITEDTANLLASYLNAIRADVSYGRIQWERIAVAVEGQSGSYVTLNDYMAQVAANTFDTAQNTQRILSELQSVIGAEGTTGAIVRVQMS